VRAAARTVLHTARAAVDALADVLLPETCATCSADRVEANHMCGRCNVDLLGLVALPYCPRCGGTLGPNIPVHDEGCWQCPTPLPRFTRVVRLGPYTGPLRRAIQALKYHHDDTLCRRLAGMLASAVAAACPADRFDAVVPILAHWSRRVLRGVDHARRLAGALARARGLLLAEELVRIRATPPQVHLSRTQRWANVRGAFQARDDRAIAGANVLLVDDVTTTGATANEAARTLLRAGALRVTLAVVAKAEPPAAYSESLGG